LDSITGWIKLATFTVWLWSTGCSDRAGHGKCARGCRRWSCPLWCRYFTQYFEYKSRLASFRNSERQIFLFSLL